MKTDIFAARLSRPLSEGEFSLLLKGADGKRYEKIKNTKTKTRADMSLLANALAKASIGRIFNLKMKEIVFDISPLGKPFLLGRGDIFFSISHCADIAVCAVSSCPVGVDIQKLHPSNDRIAKRFFTKEQFDEIENATDKDAAFTRIWTVFEACAKLYGEGIFKYANTGSCHIQTIRFEDFYISVATPLQFDKAPFLL